jgi:hypothetical protein
MDCRMSYISKTLSLQQPLEDSMWELQQRLLEVGRSLD